MSNKPYPEKKGIDPYSEFLQLPPGDRPPHFYDLLQVEIFCAHRERIEHAARDAYRQLKPFQDHPQRDVRAAIQEIISRIANARIVLTDPQRKAMYDEKLAEMLSIDRDEVLRERTAGRAPEYQITVIAGPEHVGMKLPLLPDKVLSIGSERTCDVCLPGLRMNPRHAQLDFTGDIWRVTSSADSLTLVNDERTQDVTLDDDDVIDLGGYRLRFTPIDAPINRASSQAPPISLIIRQGPSVAHPTFHAIAPAGILIGSCHTALWQLTGKQVALHHARIEHSGALWEINDLHSDTGTIHNGESVRSAILSHNDRVIIGRYEIQVRLRK